MVEQKGKPEVIRFMPDADEVAALREWIKTRKVNGLDFMTLLEMVDDEYWELDIEVQQELVSALVLKKVRYV